MKLRQGSRGERVLATNWRENRTFLVKLGKQTRVLHSKPLDEARQEPKMAKTIKSAGNGKADPLQVQIDERHKEIHTDGYPMSIGEIQNLYMSGDLDIHPEFQRFFRWSPEQKARWIESILIGIPLPSIFVSQQEDGKWDVIDGLQRLSTIFEFMGLLKDEEKRQKPQLVLTEATYLTALKGKSWSDSSSPAGPISADQQRYIKRSKLDIKIIKRQSDPSAQYEMFQRLNTGGATLTAQELRNCILISIDRDYYKWLAELSEYANFRECISLPEKLEKEAYDVELALRFVLLRKLAEPELPGSGVALGEYLTKKMVEVVTKKKLDRPKEERAFKTTFDLLAGALNSDSFRKYEKNRFTGGFSVAAYEVIALGLGYDIEKARKMTADSIRDLVKNEVWSDTSFLTSTGLAAATRLPRTLARGRSVFSK
ncbi:MAG TPA: DUF262 domain-containing protein [Planctomycetaceae bacterium]|jgi:hypothetical protein